MDESTLRYSVANRTPVITFYVINRELEVSISF